MSLNEHDIFSLHLSPIYDTLLAELANDQQATTILTDAVIGIYLFVTSKYKDQTYWQKIDRSPELAAILEKEQLSLDGMTILAALRQILEIKENQKKATQIFLREKSPELTSPLPQAQAS